MARTVALTSTFLISLLIVSASSGARSASPATCQMSRFTVAVGPYVSEATQQRTLALRLVNHAGTCVVNGYPRLKLYDARGAIPFSIRNGGDQMISSRRPRRITVRRDGSVFVVLNKGQCVDGVTPSTRGTTRIVIRAAGAPTTTDAVSIRFGSRIPMPWRIPAYCGKRDPNSIITVSPFVPTVRAALNG
jgi:Protein of unknown function (DUF4232)